MRPMRALAASVLLAAAPPAATYHDLAGDFAAVHDATQGEPEAARVAAVRHHFAAVFPGFYAARDGRSDAEVDADIARALAGFPALRPAYVRTEQDFARAFAAGIAHFRAQFSGFRLTVPVWLVHSLGEMDGGTRTIGGKVQLIFGADMIARLHDGDTIGPFLDHELFHVENGRWFRDCAPDTTMWCALWQEGTATYAAGAMNPQAGDKALMLDLPAPIRPAIDADWRGALCRARADLDATDRRTYAYYFMGGGKPQDRPKRWGYYVGYRLVQRAARTMTLAELSRLDHAAAHALVVRELDGMVAEAGGCPPSAAA